MNRFYQIHNEINRYADVTAMPWQSMGVSCHTRLRRIKRVAGGFGKA